MNYCPLCATPLETRLMDNVPRLACSAENCAYVHWDNPVPVVAALVQYRGGVLLARNAAWPEGRYSVITGFLEKGEAPEHAVLREVEEELGLQGRLKGFIGYYPFYPQNQLILAFDVARFTPLDTFKSEIDRHLRDLRESKVLPGFDAIRLPGEQRRQRRDDRARNGVPLVAELLTQLDALAADLGVQPLRER